MTPSYACLLRDTQTKKELTEASTPPYVLSKKAFDSLPKQTDRKTLTSALTDWDWKNTASLWLHFGQGWSSVRGRVGSWMTSAMIWVMALQNIQLSSFHQKRKGKVPISICGQWIATSSITRSAAKYSLDFMLDFVHVDARIVCFLLVVTVSALVKATKRDKHVIWNSISLCFMSVLHATTFWSVGEHVEIATVQKLQTLWPLTTFCFECGDKISVIFVRIFSASLGVFKLQSKVCVWKKARHNWQRSVPCSYWWVFLLVKMTGVCVLLSRNLGANTGWQATRQRVTNQSFEVYPYIWEDLSKSVGTSMFGDRCWFLRCIWPPLQVTLVDFARQTCWFPLSSFRSQKHSHKLTAYRSTLFSLSSFGYNILLLKTSRKMFSETILQAVGSNCDILIHPEIWLCSKKIIPSIIVQQWIQQGTQAHHSWQNLIPTKPGPSGCSS